MTERTVEDIIDDYENCRYSGTPNEERDIDILIDEIEQLRRRIREASEEEPGRKEEDQPVEPADRLEDQAGAAEEGVGPHQDPSPLRPDD